MFRFIDLHLKEWVSSESRKPIILRGARQVGKTFAVRKLGATFKNYIEINFEESPHLKRIFGENESLDPVRIIRDLSSALNQAIVPGETLLFFDETQVCPKVIIALRYFYEKMPTLHVIAAGSLLDFAIEKVGIPVGRTEFYYLYPVSFLEYLKADGANIMIETILNHNVNEPISEVVHDRILEKLREYLAIGGMPEVVASWVKKKDPVECSKIHHTILNSYRQDFGKYATEYQIKYVELIFENAAKQLGKKFKFSDLEGDFRKRELAPALELLAKAGVLHRIYQSTGQGIPIGATAHPDKFKVMMLDVGLTQALLGLNLSDWFLNPQSAFINRGALVEAFVGQELLTYSEHYIESKLYYWQRDVKGSEAELDFLLQLQAKIIPIEVKSDRGRTFKSMHLFMNTFPETPFGIRFSTHNYSVHEKILSYPLYAIPPTIHWNMPNGFINN